MISTLCNILLSHINIISNCGINHETVYSVLQKSNFRFQPIFDSTTTKKSTILPLLISVRLRRDVFFPNVGRV